MCPANSHRPKFPSPKLTTNMNAIPPVSPHSHPFLLSPFHALGTTGHSAKRNWNSTSSTFRSHRICVLYVYVIMRRKTYTKRLARCKCQFFINSSDFLYNSVWEISRRLSSLGNIFRMILGETENIRSSSRSSQHRITHLDFLFRRVAYDEGREWCELAPPQSPALWTCHNFRRAFRLVNLIKIIGACFSVSRLRAERPTSLLRWPCPRDIAQTSSYHYIRSSARRTTDIYYTTFLLQILFG